jgi:hypothetical protein
MADILIRGFEMPTDASLLLLIRPDCTVHKLKVGGKHGGPQQGVAVPIPKGHGRLIDADALLDDCCDVIEDHSGLDYVDPCPMWGYSADMIGRAPTIVPAEGGER